MPNQALQQTGHAIQGFARHDANFRVSRLLSFVFGQAPMLRSNGTVRMQVDPNKPAGDDQHRHKKRWWVWFLTGFLAVFVFMAFTVTMYSMHPSGDAVVSCKLWQYYLTEIQRALTSRGAFGPANGSGAAALRTALLHLFFSAAGGAAMMGIGWVVYKIKGH